MITLPVVGVEHRRGRGQRGPPACSRWATSTASSGGRSSRAIVVPSTLPYLIAGMKVGFGLALKVSVVRRDLRRDLRHRLHHELQPRDPRDRRWSSCGRIVMILVMIATDKLVFDDADAPGRLMRMAT